MILRPIVCASLCVLMCTACEFELDTERDAPERASLGQEVYRILKQDLDRLHPKKGLAFTREEQRFVRAFDTLMPDEMLSDLQAYLVAILPLYDDGILQAAVRPLACILERLSQEPVFLQALWYASHTTGYGCDTHSPLLRRVLDNPVTPGLLEHLGSLWLAHDGLDTGMVLDETEDDTFRALLQELAGKMASAEIDSDPECTASVLVDFLLSTDGRLMTGQGEAQWLVRTDIRGRARPALQGDGQPVEPFVDMDSDGLADIDPVSGDFLDENSVPLDVPPPFGPDGSRSTLEGDYIYQYTDLRQSVLGALVDQLEPLVADGFIWELPDALPAMLGEIVARADSEGTYPGYEPDDSPLVALAHAGLELIDYDRLPEMLEVVLTLAELREPQLARFLHEIDVVSEIVDDYDHLKLADNNRLFDDLVPHLLEAAEAGCLLPYLRSFSDSRVAGLQAGLADMIRYRDHLDDEVPGGMQFGLDTDFDLPDTEYANRSNLQKMLHLTYDTNGAEHATEVIGYDVFTIHDMLVFWLDSAADTSDPDEGLAEVPWYVNTAVTEFESEHPGVEQVNRFMNHDHTVLGNPVGHEGFELLNYNAESLLAMEASGALDAMKPGISANAYCQRGAAKSGIKIHAELLAALHPHYSVNRPDASRACANVRALEPMLLDVMDNSEVVSAGAELVGSLDGMTTSSGLDVLEELDRFTLHVLQPDGTVLRHDGENWVYACDDVTQISPISSLYLLLDAMRRVDDAVEGDPAADAAVERTAELLSDRFLEVEQTEGVWRFANRRAWFAFLNAISFFRERAAKHRDAGRLSEELADIESDLRDAVGGRVTPRLVTALQLIAADAHLPGELDAIVLDLLDASDAGWVRTVRKNLAWLLQDLLVDRVMVPAAHALAPRIDPRGEDGYRLAFDPDAGACLSGLPPEGQPANALVSRLMTLVVRMARTSIEGGRDVFAELILNSGKLAAGPDGFPLHDFGKVIAALHRDDPEATGEKSALDLKSILWEVSDYLLDDVRGLEKLYEQVERRKGF